MGETLKVRELAALVDQWDLNLVGLVAVGLVAVGLVALAVGLVALAAQPGLGQVNSNEGPNQTSADPLATTLVLPLVLHSPSPAVICRVALTATHHRDRVREVVPTREATPICSNFVALPDH